jgi:hypothetical protein
MKALNRLVAIIAALVLAACSGGDTHEKIVDDLNAQMDKLGTAVASVTDKASAEKAVTEIKTVSTEMKAIAERAKKIGDPSKEVQAKLEAKMKTKQEEMVAKMVGAQANLTKAGPEAALILKGGMDEFGATMQEVEKAFKK